MTLQSDPGWLIERRGLLTASRMADALDYLKKGGEGANRKAYKIELVAERASDWAVSHYVTPAMQRGLDFEGDARRAYESHTGYITEPARLVHHPRIEFFSGTPDSFIDHDGLAEFKVPMPNTFVKWRIAGAIPEEHMPQLWAQLAITQRAWVDFCAYSPEMPPGKNLLIRRLEANAEEIANIEAGAKAFLDEVEAMFRAFTECAA